MGSTVELTNQILSEIDPTSTNRMHYIPLQSGVTGIGFEYDDGQNFEVGASLTDGNLVDYVYFSEELGNLSNQIGGTNQVDLLLGLSGNDEFFMSGGIDWVYGGPGDDRINYVNAPSAVDISIALDGTIDLQSGGFGVVDNLFSIEIITGSNHGDNFSYAFDPNLFPLLEIDGGDGVDTFDFSANVGGIVLSVGAGSSDLNIYNTERIILSGHDDEATMNSGMFSRGVTFIDGGEGVDTLNFSGNSFGVSLANNVVDGITLVNFEQVHLTGFDDVISISVGANPYTLIDGGDGTDTLDLSTGGGVTNLVFGDGANDTLNLQSIEEIVLGGGADTITVTSNTAFGDFPENRDSMSLDGGGGHDTLGEEFLCAA